MAQSKKRKAIANLITSAAAGSTSLPKKKKRERSKKEKADATGALPAESAADAKNDQGELIAAYFSQYHRKSNLMQIFVLIS